MAGSDSSFRPKRPLLVTLVAMMVLTITAIHLVRFLQALAWWDFLSSLPRVSPLYLALTGLFWSLTGLAVWFGLWFGRPGYPSATRFLALAYALFEWLDRTLASSVTEEMNRWPFAAGFTVLLLLIVFWTFSRPGVKVYFGDTHEQRLS